MRNDDETPDSKPRALSRRAFEIGAAAATVAVAVNVRPAAARETAAGTIVGKVSSTPPKYAKDVIVHVVEAAGTFRPPAKTVKMDQKNMKFVPHVLPVLKGSTVEFLNNDAVRHNVFSPDGEKYDLGTWPKGESRKYTFKRLGMYRQLCNIHPEMSAFILVLQNPYFATTDDDGNFSIPDVPAGTYVLRAWSEKLPAVTQSVTVSAGGKTTANLKLERGR